MSIRETNTLMNASAGTGKTFWLATHNIRLLLLGKRPAEITALTFSRAAAEEIYVKIASRLADASSDKGALAESETVFHGIQGQMKKKLEEKFPRGVIGKETFISLLRVLINDQYLGTISTIDSFIWRLVRIFPLELGMQGKLVLLDESQQEDALKKVCTDFFTGAPEQEEVKEFTEAFDDALNGADSRNYAEKLSLFIQNWRQELLSHTECTCGNPQAIWRNGEIPFPSERPAEEIAGDLKKLLLRMDEKQSELWNHFIQFVRNFGPSTSFPQIAWWKNTVNACRATEHSQNSLVIKLNRKDITFPPEEAKFVREGISHVLGTALRGILQRAKGVGMLMRKIEERYDATTRRTGKLTFDDLPRLFNRLDRVNRLNIEYRFDEKTNHWALDEFQDTSRPQWQALSNLVDEAVQNEEKTVSVVGDSKQAIYRWRQGDVNIFIGLNRQAEYTEPPPLSTSYRYGPTIASFINRVFGEKNLSSFDFQENVSVALQEKWISRWRDHVSARTKCDDFIKILRVEKAEAKRLSPEDYVRVAVEEIRTVRAAHPAAVMAILVRANKQGELFAQALKEADIPVVFEGESTVCDTPVVQAFLHLLHLSEHPEDSFDRAFLRMTPLPAALALLQKKDDTQKKDLIEGLAEMVSRDVNKLGLTRALQQYVDLLDKKTLNDFSIRRLESMIRCAALFEESMNEKTNLSDFADYLDRQRERDYSSPHSVKILSIHRSKGLGFDYVLVPLIETGSVAKPNPTTHLLAEDGSWAMPRLPEDLCSSVPEFRSAYNAQCANALLDNLCTFYVAMTRAKYALTVLVRPDASRSSEKDSTIYFSNFVKRAFPSIPFSEGNSQWKEKQRAGSSVSADMTPPCGVENGREKKEKKIVFATPSSSFGMEEERCASGLFVDVDDDTRTHGLEVHAAFAKIEWLDSAAPLSGMVTSPSKDFLRAFRKTADVRGLWRERSFEILNDDQWMTGQFDRVVFYGEDRASVYDFKTNHLRKDETPDAFAKRMVTTYSGQMHAYREAVRHLTGRKIIESFLLLVSTGSCVCVDE